MPTPGYNPIPKPAPRIRNKRAYEAARLPWCELCGQVATDNRRIVPHHLKTRGAGGGDTAENLISLCETINRTGCHDRLHAGRLGEFEQSRMEQVLAQRHAA